MKAEIIINAENKKVGRIASEIAKALRGKTDADFLPHRTVFPKVVVQNVDNLNFSEKKLKEKMFWRYSGYPGGRIETSAHEIAKKDKREVLRHAILGMLPKNRLTRKMIKNLDLRHGN